MNRLASLCTAAAFVAAFYPGISVANDGGGLAEPSVGPKRCPSAAISSYQRALDKAQDKLDDMQGRTVTRAEFSAAKAKVAKAKERLAKARAGRC